MHARHNRQRQFEFSTEGKNLPLGVRRFFRKHQRAFAEHPNWWIKGGAARSTLTSYLRRRMEPAVQWEPEETRDYDILIVRDQVPLEDVVSLFGGDVEEQDIEFAPSMESYLRTRDLGINEVALRPDRMVCSLKAINDFMKNTVAPSGHEGGPHMRYRVALRGLLIAAREGLEPSPRFYPVAGDASPFDLLIHLFKAYETGVEDTYLHDIQKAGHRYALASRTPYEFLNLLMARVYGFYLTEKQQQIFDRAKSDYEQEYYQALTEWMGHAH